MNIVFVNGEVHQYLPTNSQIVFENGEPVLFINPKPGYSHTVIGVEGGSISKVLGVEAASISKVLGVE
mgnify:CR=1 FL=1